MIRWWILLGVSLVVLIVGVWWHRFREDFREFQEIYHIRLPFWVHVTWTREHDQVRWGRKRYRFIRADGGKDRRRALNIKMIYPTVLIVNTFKMYIIDINYARQLFYRMQDYMHIPLADCTFEGDIRGDLYRHFRGRRIRFVRHVGKIFFRYGWYGEITYDEKWDLLIQREGRTYAVFCVFTPKVVGAMLLSKIPKLVDVVYRVVVTNTTFTNGAIEYAKANNILLMDKRHMNLTFDVNFIVFVGRQG